VTIRNIITRRPSALMADVVVTARCSSPWGTYEYRAKRKTSRDIREAMESVGDKLERDVLDCARRYGAGVRPAHPFDRFFSEMAMGAHELARDERIRDSCREIGWEGNQETWCDMDSCLNDVVRIRMDVRAPDAAHFARILNVDARVVETTILAYLRGNASSMTAEEHLARMAMGLLWGELETP
jgi:hypothetical protein